MRFADTNGAIMDIYQAPTQMTDESGQSYPYTVDTLLDGALGPEGYYGAFVANMHTDADPEPEADAIFWSATNHGVPIISSRQLLTWLDARNGSAISSINWSGNSETFSVQASASARGLQVMVPVPGGYSASAVTYNGSSLAYGATWIKGIDTPRSRRRPEFTKSVMRETPLRQALPQSCRKWVLGGEPGRQRHGTFSEPMASSSVNVSTITLSDVVGQLRARHRILQPRRAYGGPDSNSSVGACGTYTATVEDGTGGVTDLAGNALQGRSPLVIYHG